ncbi:hypothetical protein F5141DRAFT_1086612 [Pisolithus sp. B1]|nr:hypothetical protein F5141DRAFT_1086612 [Pisolithus sp. B1]
MRCSPEAPPTPQGVASPSLVSLLQKINGLSRKKVYGTQTSRLPFCGEELVEPNTDKPRRLCPFPSFQGDESGSNKSGTGRIRSPERAPSPSEPISPARRSPRHRRGIFPSGMKTIPTLTAPPSTVHGPLPVTSVHPESPAYMSSGPVLATPLTCVPSQQPVSSARTSNAIPRYAGVGDASFLFSSELETTTAAIPVFIVRPAFVYAR